MEILDYIVELGLDAGLKYFKNRLNTNKLKDSLRQYIINQEAYIAIFNNIADSTLTFEKKWYNRGKEGECYAAQRS